MNASRGIFRYGLYLFIGAWMFALGVIVGRGTSPVTFDTESFQERLRVIVGQIPKTSPEEDKVDLDFFKTLNKPVVKEPVVMPEDSGGTGDSMAAASEPRIKENEGPIPVKVGLKLATRNRMPAAATKADASVKKSSVKKEVPLVADGGAEKSGGAEVPTAAAPSEDGRLHDSGSRLQSV